MGAALTYNIKGYPAPNLDNPRPALTRDSAKENRHESAGRVSHTTWTPIKTPYVTLRQVRLRL